MRACVRACVRAIFFLSVLPHPFLKKTFSLPLFIYFLFSRYDGKRGTCRTEGFKSLSGNGGIVRAALGLTFGVHASCSSAWLSEKDGDEQRGSILS